MPLPDVALERSFGVDFVLVHVQLLAEHLFDWAYQACVMAQEAKRLVIGGPVAGDALLKCARAWRARPRRNRR